METIFIDSNIISLCTDEFLVQLKNKGLTPVIGCNTTYENMRCFLSKEPKKGSELASMVLKINPLIVRKRDELLQCEIQKLLNGYDFSPFIKLEDWPELSNRLINFSKGIFDQNYLNSFQLQRQESYKKTYSTDHSDKSLIEHLKTTKITFDVFYAQFFEKLFKHEKSHIEYVSKLIGEEFKNEGIISPNLNDEYIKLLIDNFKDFPFLKALISCYVYMKYLTNRPYVNTGYIPKKFGLSDRLQILESSYCQMFLTDDFDLKKHLTKINSTIGVVGYSELSRSDCTLGDLAEILMGQSPPGETCNTFGIGVPLLNGPTEFDKFHPKAVQFTEQAKKVCFVDDILFCVRGSTTGRMSWADLPYAIGRGLAAIRHKNGAKYNHYLKALIEHHLSRILGGATGSTFPNVSRELLLNVNVNVPLQGQQLAISLFYKAIHKKIKILHEMNQTLESIAQTLFKSWFIDFDPVRAKAEGRQSEGMDAETAALFPDSFEESELGLVPKGWEINKIENLLELCYGKALTTTDRLPGDIPVYGSGGITGYHNEFLVDGPSIIIGRKGTVGSFYWEDRSFFPIDTVFYVKTKIPLTYCFYLLRTLRLNEMNTDAAVPGLNRNNVYRLPVVIGTNKVVSSFDKLISNLRKKIYFNLEYSKTLSSIRDVLLPKLISGKLKIVEAELLCESIYE